MYMYSSHVLKKNLNIYGPLLDQDDEAEDDYDSYDAETE